MFPLKRTNIALCPPKYYDFSELCHVSSRAGSMHTFRSLNCQLGLIPGSMALALAGVDLGLGRGEADRQQHPEALKTLIAIARIHRSVERNRADHCSAQADRGARGREDDAG